jgi:hypothetical protein
MVVKRVTRKRLVKKTRKVQVQRGGARRLYGFANGPKTSIFNAQGESSTNNVNNVNAALAPYRAHFRQGLPAVAATISKGDLSAYRSNSNMIFTPNEEAKFWAKREKNAAAAERASQKPTVQAAIASRLLQETARQGPGTRILSKMQQNITEKAGYYNHELRIVPPKLNPNTAMEHLETFNKLNSAHKRLTEIRNSKAREQAMMTKGRRFATSIAGVFRPNIEKQKLKRTVQKYASDLANAKYNTSPYTTKASKTQNFASLAKSGKGSKV